MPNLGFKHSEESKKKMSTSHKGKPFVGQHLINFNKARYGRVQSEATKLKISKSKQGQGKGQKRSIEFRKNLSEKRKGKNNPMYIDGRTPSNDIARQGMEIHLWRDAVFLRDNYTCQKTGIRGGILRAHHVLNFAEYPDLRTSIENGITLSKKAHEDFHKIYGIKNNTREQLNEFLYGK